MRAVILSTQINPCTNSYLGLLKSVHFNCLDWLQSEWVAELGTALVRICGIPAPHVHWPRFS